MSPHNMSTIDVYIKADDKIKLLQKARKMGISVSRLLVLGVLNYNLPEEPVVDDAENGEAQP